MSAKQISQRLRDSEGKSFKLAPEAGTTLNEALKEEIGMPGKVGQRK